MKLITTFLLFTSFLVFSQSDSTKKKITFYDENGEQVEKAKVIEDPRKNLIKLEPTAIFLYGEVGLLYERKIIKRISWEFGAGSTIYIVQGHYNGKIHSTDYSTKYGYYGKTSFKFFLKNSGSYFGEGVYLSPSIRHRKINFFSDESSQSIKSGRINISDFSLNIGNAFRTQYRFITDTFIGLGIKRYDTQYSLEISNDQETINLSGIDIIINFGFKIGLAF